MPVISNWDDDAHTIIRNDFIAPWAWPEMVKISKEAYAKIAQLTERGDIIANGWTNLPPGNAMNAFRQVVVMPENLGLLVLVAPEQSILGRTLINTYLQISRVRNRSSRVIFVNTLEEARALLKRERVKSKTSGTRT